MQSKFQMIKLISDCHIGVPREYTNMASHTDLCEVLRSLGKRSGLKLWELPRLFTFYNMTISRLFPLDGFRLIYLLRHSENDLPWSVPKWDGYRYLYMPSLRSSHQWRDHFVSSKWFLETERNTWACSTYAYDWYSPCRTLWLRWFDINCTGPYLGFLTGVLSIFSWSDSCENYTSFCKESKFG